MNKIECKECGKEINSKAEICPHCGCRVKSNTLKIAVVCVVVILSFFGIYYGIKQIQNREIEKKLIEDNKQEKKQQEDIRNKLIGKYTINKDDYVNFVESLKKTKEHISSSYNGESDFEFEINDNNISKYMGFDGVNYNDTIAYNSEYVLIPLGLLGIDRAIGSIAIFRIDDNELTQVSADKVDSILENFSIDNYNLKCKKA